MDTGWLEPKVWSVENQGGVVRRCAAGDLRQVDGAGAAGFGALRVRVPELAASRDGTIRLAAFPLGSAVRLCGLARTPPRWL